MESKQQSEELVAIRNQLGWDIRTFARRLNVKETTYKNWEYAKTKAIPDKVLNAARVLLTQTNFESTGAPLGAKGVLRPVDGVADDSPMVVPSQFIRDGFRGFRVQDDALMGLIQPDDLVVIKTRKSPLPGVLFCAVPDDTSKPAVIRELVYESGRWLLRPWNERGTEVDLTGYQLAGFVVGIISRDKVLAIGPVDDGLTKSRLESLFISRNL